MAADIANRPVPTIDRYEGIFGMPRRNRAANMRASFRAVLVVLLVSATAACTSPGPQSATTTSAVPSPSSEYIRDLPRIPWEGGPDYWRQFRSAADWTDPNFFPIGIWFGGFDNDEEIGFDADHGITFYTGGLWQATDFNLLRRHGMYWVGDRVNDGFDSSSTSWPGVFLGDEIDGTAATPDEGFRELGSAAAAEPNHDRFRYANFTQLVVGSDMPLADQEEYVNTFADVVSLDMYWYTVDFCSDTPERGSGYAVPVSSETCRTASSYGKMASSLGKRDSVDGKLVPKWMFIENLNGAGGGANDRYIEPSELEGAAISSIIHEARGIVWFNQSLSGPCQGSNVIRDAQFDGATYCGAAQIQAMGTVNNLIKSLAPVINTQTYEWRFGDGLDTMLKVEDGSAYVFAMTDGTTGERTFTLPTGLVGNVEVIGESRSITPTDGRFTDDFDSESAFHIYRIRLG